MKKITGTLTAALMLALGGVALANDPAMENTDTTQTDMEKQSGVEKKDSTDIDVKQLKGEQAMKLQQSLKEQGLYHGQVDGQIGPRTVEALRKFQEQKGFSASGKLDQQTCEALGIEPSDIQPVSGSDTSTDTQTQPQSGTDTTQPAASPTPMTNSGSTTTEPDSGVDKAGQAGQSGTSSDVDTQSGDATGDTTNDDALPGTSNDTATGTGSMNSDVEGTTDEDISNQSGSDTSTSNEDSTSPVTGGDTSATETEPQSGDSTTGTESMGGVTTDDDPNVVNDSDIEPQAGTSSTFDKKTIKEVETALKQKKLFKGKVDGVLDDQTEQAIRAFQSQQGFNVTGRLDAQTLSALGVKSNIDNQSGVNGTGTNTNTGTGTDMGTNDGSMTTPAPNETPAPTPSDPTNPNPSNPNPMTPR